MRIVQLIDSLEIGGAERIAVNYANALAERNTFSGIVVTRHEGKLRDHLSKKLNYLFLKRKRTIDIKAVLRLKTYCKANEVEFIHAHASSFFIAFLLKLLHPTIKIIWHDHTGARGVQKLAQNKALWFSSRFFSGIIVVNHALEAWCKRNLFVKSVLYLPNFTMHVSENQETKLHGKHNNRILLLANLRNPKNHSLLIKIAIRIKESHPQWTFHMIGKDHADSYSKEIKHDIKINGLEETVYIYGSRTDTANIIKQSEICVLTSTSEGLPVSLLEYGLQRKSVVSTEVGEIPSIIKNGINGFTVPNNDVELFSTALTALMDSIDLRLKIGNELYNTVMENHSEQVVIEQYLNWLKAL